MATFFKTIRKGFRTSTVRSDGKHSTSYVLGNGKSKALRQTITYKSDGTCYQTTTERSGSLIKRTRRTIVGKPRKQKIHKSSIYRIKLPKSWSSRKIRTKQLHITKRQSIMLFKIAMIVIMLITVIAVINS